ncbi:hypothetical protein [Xanthomonas bonasiae]|nr:hypothetical protein [Xanthomonas bonasiae]
MDLLFLLLLLTQRRRPPAVASAMETPPGPPPLQRSAPMPTATPVPLIKPVNRLFASLDIDTTHYVFSATQLPSTYYMTGKGPFIRLRPLHRSGFGIFEYPERIVALYTGDWDRNLTFTQNLNSNQSILHCRLGDSADDIAKTLGVLQKKATRTTQEIEIQNTAQNPPPITDQVVFVNDGALAGTIWGERAGNRYEPMKIVDARQGNAKAHTGHPFATRAAAERFYADQYPGVLDQLMLLGQAQQSFAIDLAPKGRQKQILVQSELQYFAEDMFESREQQLGFLRDLYMSFV